MVAQAEMRFVSVFNLKRLFYRLFTRQKHKRTKKERPIPIPPHDAARKKRTGHPFLYQRVHESLEPSSLLGCRFLAQSLNMRET